MLVVWPVFHPHIIEPTLSPVKHVPGFRYAALAHDGGGTARIRWRAAGRRSRMAEWWKWMSSTFPFSQGIVNRALGDSLGHVEKVRGIFRVQKCPVMTERIRPPERSIMVRSSATPLDRQVVRVRRGLFLQTLLTALPGPGRGSGRSPTATAPRRSHRPA